MSQFITKLKMSQFITKLKSTQSMQSIPMYTKAGSRLPATPTAEVGRVDLRTPAVMVSPETIGVLVPGSPVAGDRVRLKGAQDRGEGIQPVVSVPARSSHMPFFSNKLAPLTNVKKILLILSWIHCPQR